MLPAETAWRLDYSLQISSHSVGEIRGDEELLLDGESWRQAIRLRMRLGSRLEAGLEIPWLRHSGGSLDELIDNWHSTFGLPEGIRDQRPTDELAFSYQSAKGALDFRRARSGIGDVRLSGGYLLSRDESRSVALRLGVELPTGDAGKLTGSGGTDVSLGIAWQRSAPGGRWTTELAGGVIRFGGSELPVPEIRDWGAWLQAGAGWELSPRIELSAGIQAASSPIDSRLTTYRDGSLMLSLGAVIGLGADYRLTLGFTEDISIESAPDIIFFLRLSRH